MSEGEAEKSSRSAGRGTKLTVEELISGDRGHPKATGSSRACEGERGL